MEYVLSLCVLLATVQYCACQSPTTEVFNVVTPINQHNQTFACRVSSAGKRTRWTILNEDTDSALMSFQNETCNVSPTDSFLNDARYLYSCNSTIHQVTLKGIADTDINSILACRDGLQIDAPGSTWIIKGPNCNCETTIAFDVLEVLEGYSLTFVCSFSSEVAFTSWNKNLGIVTSIGYQGSQCNTTSSSTFLNNITNYAFTCNKTVYQVTRLNVQRSEHNDIYMCTAASQNEGTGSNWIIKVQAPVTSVALTQDNDKIYVPENTTIVFTCTTSTSRPEAAVYWYSRERENTALMITENIISTTDYNDLRVTNSTLRFIPTRQHNNTKIFCTANNSVNTSPVSSDMEIVLNVLYKADDPYISHGNEYRVIENTTGTLNCSVKGGNPRPSLSWKCNNSSITNQSIMTMDEYYTTTTLTWTAFRHNNGTCTCMSQQEEFQNMTRGISLIVLYPPSKPILKVNGDGVVRDILFIEGTTRNITCSADSKPSPHTYTWTGPAVAGSINIQTLTFNHVKRNKSGEYTCSVNNTMNPSSGESVVGFNTTVVNVLILYPPVVKPMHNISEPRGKQLNLICNFSAGIPEHTLITWTRDVDHTEWNTSVLNISSLEKNDTGMYTCTASNIMIPSGDNESYIGQHNQSFYLDILYTNVTSFLINGDASETKTVNEHDTLRFICDVDSNPTAMATLSVGTKKLVNVTSNSVEYNITKVDCLDAGSYYCSANNMHNNIDKLLKELFVNCYPRAAGVIDTNITSERNESITIVFNYVAYPQPNFTWYQLVSDIWTILHDGDKYDINSSNTQSNLTVHSVAADDFTSYEVKGKNDFGEVEHLFFLSPYDKPDLPTEFRHIEGYSTTSSIHLKWTPGFDNGPSQTFYIKYRKSSDTTWNYVIVSDNGKQTMELTLTELTADTQYEIVIFASNEKGNSSESVLVARTLAIDNPPSPGPLIGGIAGGITGCIILVIVIIVIIRRYPVFKRKGANEPGIRRSVSDDSDDDDGLVDNPMYVSSNNVASAVPSSSGVTTAPQKPKQANMTSHEDVYTVVNKTKKQDKVQKGKKSTGKNAGKEVDVYENVELANKPAKNDCAKQSSQQNVPKLKVVNKDGLIYADLVFNDKPPGEKMVINGNDPTPYALVDFTKKAEPLPESDNDDEQ